MSGQLKWSNDALDQLAAISEFLEQFSPQYADELSTRLVAAADKLKSFPELGRKCSEFNSRHLRELLVEQYRIVYHIDQQSINIISVRHQAQKH